MLIILLAILGLIFGSFINALVWRLHEKRSIVNGRSMCVHCHHQLAWFDLIPVISWLSLGGQCRYCKKVISWQYPLVELTTSALFALSFLSWPRVLDGPYEQAYFELWLITLVILITLAVYDLRWLSLPDKLNWPFVLTGVLSMVILSVISSTSVTEHLSAVIIAWGFFALLYYGSKGKWLGGGDVKYALGMGAWLGYPQVIVGLLMAFYSASLVIIPLLLFKIVHRKQPIPFGPFLILGTIIAMLYGQDLVDWYQQTFFFGGV